MGAFRYIVSGSKENCHRFLEDLPHCYSKDIYDEVEYGDNCDLWIWGDCKYLPDIWWIQDNTRQLHLTLKGSYQNEDREPDEEAGTYIHLVNGMYRSSDFAGDEMMFLDISEYEYD